MKPKRRKLLRKIVDILNLVNADLRQSLPGQHISLRTLDNLGDAIALLQNDLDLDDLKAKTNENAAGRCK